MKTNDLISIGKNTLGNDMVLIVLVVCLLLVCGIKYLFAKNFKTLNNKNEYMSFTDDNTTLFSFFVNGITVLLISILLVTYFDVSYEQYFNFKFHYLSTVGITFGIISVMMLFRLLIEVTFYRVFYEKFEFCECQKCITLIDYLFFVFLYENIKRLFDGNWLYLVVF